MVTGVYGMQQSDTLIINKQIEKLKEKAAKYCHTNTEKSLAYISSVAKISYDYNQYYTDEELESLLLQIADTKITHRFVNPDNNTVLFYDAFGLDIRGHVIVYTKAIAMNGYKLVYVTTKRAINKQPKLKAELEDFANVEWVYIDIDTSYIHWIEQLAEQFEIYKPNTAFFYSTPWDVSGTVVFNAYKNIVTRFLIDLTDHAFWLGVNTSDYFIGSRDYSASIQHFYRGIPVEKMKKLDVNLYIDKHIALGELPFDVEKTRFIFSGGSLYKTLGDPENKFYRIVAHILKKYPDVVFLYAGSGDATQMNRLEEKFKDRVFLVPERPDFYRIMEKCLFYLNTYPMFGGLMMRYAAIARKLPLTLRHEHDADGILMNQEQLGVEYDDLETMLTDIDKIIENGNYRKDKEVLLEGSVMTENRFANNIKNLIENHATEFSYSVNMIDTQSFRKEYIERFNFEQSLYNAIVKKINKSLALDYPFFFSKAIIKKLFR